MTVRVQLTDSNEFAPSFSQSLTAAVQENLPMEIGAELVLDSRWWQCWHSAVLTEW